MELTFTHYIILYCLNKLSGERTIYSILHLLNGKKSAQTIQDAHIFQLENLFNVDPFLTRKELSKETILLFENNLIEIAEGDNYRLTKLGTQKFNELSLRYKIPGYLKGWKLHKVSSLFWERLTLLIQVSSNLINNNKQYIPVQSSDDTKSWLKIFLKECQHERLDFSQILYGELRQLLDSSDDIMPEVFVIRLTGYKQIGLTNSQAANELNLNRMFYSFHFFNVIHYLIEQCRANRRKYTVLNKLIFEQGLPYTASTEKTLTLLRQNYNLQQISEIRNLKMSTIEDHIVEIALIDRGFSIDNYVHNELQQRIISAIKTLNSRQLKVLKKYVPEASYFSIRLTLAKYGDKL